MKNHTFANVKRLATKALAMLVAVLMVASMMPVVAFATEEEPGGYVYLSISFDGQYIDDKYGDVIMYRPVALADIAAIDLTEYGLDNMLFDADGDGEYEITALQLLIYAHEELWGGDWSEVNFIPDPGSSYFQDGLFGFTENLVYFLNGDFPIDESQDGGWYTVGATSDRIVLEDGDFLDVASFGCYSFLWDQLGGFHLFADQDGNYVHDYEAEAGEPLSVKLMHSFCDLMYGIAWVQETADFEVYYGSVYGEAEGSVTTDECGNAEIIFPTAGTYYVWSEGGLGSDDGTHGPCDYYNEYGEPCPVSSPAYAKVTVTGEAAEETGHTCADSNNDHECDVCNAPLSDCADTDNNHKCDKCGATLSECADGNSDHKCDTCDKTLSECADGNSDHKCDTCDKTLSECADGNSDHKCDTCDKTLSECADGNSDHKCDTCGAPLSTCADGNKDHNCDTCGAPLSTCADGNSDHKCDTCDKTLSECADGNSDHKCDTCDKTLSECADGNSDHKCDKCGATGMGDHVDEDDDHLCDYGCGQIADGGCFDSEQDHVCDECGAPVGVHADGNDADHLCDYCQGDVGETCYDLNKDHACDECGVGGMGEHRAANGKHTCTYCRQAITRCVDADDNGKCDICGDILNVNTYVQSGFESIGNGIVNSIADATEDAMSAVGNYVQAGFEAVGNSIANAAVDVAGEAVAMVAASVGEGMSELGAVGYDMVVVPIVETAEAIGEIIYECVHSIFNLA